MTRFRPPILSMEEADRLTIYRRYARGLVRCPTCGPVYSLPGHLRMPSVCWPHPRCFCQRRPRSSTPPSRLRGQMVLSTQTAPMPRCELRGDMKRSDGVNALKPEACIDCVDWGHIERPRCGAIDSSEKLQGPLFKLGRPVEPSSRIDFGFTGGHALGSRYRPQGKPLIGPRPTSVALNPSRSQCPPIVCMDSLSRR